MWEIDDKEKMLIKNGTTSLQVLLMKYTHLAKVGLGWRERIPRQKDKLLNESVI